jgi:hypothetical protein
LATEHSDPAGWRTTYTTLVEEASSAERFTVRDGRIVHNLLVFDRTRSTPPGAEQPESVAAGAVMLRHCSARAPGRPDETAICRTRANPAALVPGGMATHAR